MNTDKLIADTLEVEFPARIDYVNSRKLYCIKFRGELVVCNNGKFTFLSVAAAKSSFFARYEGSCNTVLSKYIGRETYYNNYEEHLKKIKDHLLSMIKVEEYVSK